MGDTAICNLIKKAGLSQRDLAKSLGFHASTISRWKHGQRVPAVSVYSSLLDQHKKYVSSLVKKSGFEGRFRFVDLFAGIGGFRKAFDGIGGQCVFTSEWDRFARETYEVNFASGLDHQFRGDITAVSEHEIPEHDLLLAGFPCQPFSLAGVSKKNSLGRKHGFLCDTQGTLFFDVARIISHHRPRAFVLENVKNLISHDRGKTFKVIRKTLEEDLGYSIQWRVIDAKGFVPQHRERIFIVGFAGSHEFDFNSLEIPGADSGPKLASILHAEDGSEISCDSYLDQSGNVLSKYILTDGLWDYLQRYAEKHRAKGNGFGFGLVGPADTARTLSARYYKDGSEILIKRKSGNPRRLTPRECSRLMGFDLPGKSDFMIPVSDTQSYRQFGNAVVVPVVEAIAWGISPWLPMKECFVQKELFQVDV